MALNSFLHAFVLARKTFENGVKIFSGGKVWHQVVEILFNRLVAPEGWISSAGLEVTSGCLTCGTFEFAFTIARPCPRACQQKDDVFC